MKTSAYHSMGRQWQNPPSRRHPLAYSWQRHQTRTVSLSRRPAFWLLVFSLFSLGLSIWIHSHTLVLTQRTNKIQSRHNELLQRQQGYVSLLNGLKRPESIQSMAGQRLGLVPLTNGQARWIDSITLKLVVGKEKDLNKLP